MTTATGLGSGAGVLLLRRGCSRVFVAGVGPTEPRRVTVRVAVRGDPRTGSGGGSAGPFKVKETRRGREEVAVEVAAAMVLEVTALGFSGAAITGVAGAGVDFRIGFGGDGAGGARGIVDVTVSVVTFSGAGRACSLFCLFKEGLDGEGADSTCLRGSSDLGVSSRFLFFAEDFVGSFGFALLSLGVSLLLGRPALTRGFVSLVQAAWRTAL